MIIYRAYKAYYDEHTHLGVFHEQYNAWIACYKHYKEKLIYKVCLKHLVCLCRQHRLRTYRFTRYYIIKEFIK